MTTQREHFRTDIAALRAIAVLLVLFSHFGIPGFGFGFIGVDIFFVISGYLITRILYKDYISSSDKDSTNTSLSLSTFYLRRIRRLLPAAFTVIIAVNLISRFAFNVNARDELYLDSKWALFFLANVAFLRSGSDYFQQNSEPSMLQHYWSLSVEEQFYFVWPLLFLLAAHFQKIKFRNKYFRFNKRLLILIALSSTLSLIFLQFSFKSTPLSSYFSLFTRAWELGVGAIFGILAFHKKKINFYSRAEKYGPFLLSLAITSLLISDHNWAYIIPIPVLSVGFLLYAGQDAPPNSRGTVKYGNSIGRFLIYVGGISYSLYLVHWPIYIIAVHFRSLDRGYVKFLLIPISILVAHFLWKFVEIPFQKIPLTKKTTWDRRIFLFLKPHWVAILGVFGVVIGSLYLVTYPSSSKGIFYSDSALTGLKNDPNLQSFADYQKQLLTNSGNQSSDTPTSGSTLAGADGVSTSSNGLSASDLLAQVQDKLKLALTQTKLTDNEVLKFKTIRSDESPYEKANCANVDSAVPPNCKSGSQDTNSKRVALIGDSKMAHLAQPFIDYFKAKGWQVEPMALFGCHMSSPTTQTLRAHCLDRSKYVSDIIAKGNYSLVISAEYPSIPVDLKYTNDYFSNIISHTDMLMILQQMPKIPDPRDCVKADYTYTPECSQISKLEKTSWSGNLDYYNKLASSKVIVVDSYKWVCINDVCPILNGDVFTFRDGVHLTYSYVKQITPLINSVLDSIYKW